MPVARERPSANSSTEPSIEMSFDARNAARAQRLDRTNGQIREQEPDGAAGQGQDDALGEHLQNKPAASGAECGADGDFLPADRCAHQQQVGDIRARDQDDDADGRETT